MSVISDFKSRMASWRRAKKDPVDVSKLKEEEKIELEKGDFLAILIAGFFNFILPIIFICAVIYLIAYFFLIHI